MCRNKFFNFFIWFVINCFSLASTDHWASHFNRARQLQHDIIEEKNETSFNQDSLEYITVSSTERDSLFWTIPGINETTKENVKLQMNYLDTTSEKADFENGTLNKKEEIKVQDSNFVETKPVEESEMDEKIVLQRNNCHLVIAVQDIRDLKIQIKFSRLQNGTSGKCCITLNGLENSLLAILISNIHLYRNGSEGEILRVIIANQGTPFVLKEYLYGDEYQPLILTETHKVLLVLHYNVTTVFLNTEETHFNLVVLTYHKYENLIEADKAGNFSPVKDQNWNKFYV